MKKLISLLLVIITCISLAGCEWVEIFDVQASESTDNVINTTSTTPPIIY